MTLPATPPPADETGQYPHLSGFAPATAGERVSARIIESIIWGVILVMMWVVIFASVFAAASTGASDVGAGIGALLVYGLLAASVIVPLYLMLAKGTTLGGLVMGLRNVDVRTGQIAGGKTFVKYLLEGLIMSITLGLGGILLFTTLKPPLGRHWFDRQAGVMVINTKRGRAPGPMTSVPAATPHTAQPADAPGIHNVGYPGSGSVMSGASAGDVHEAALAPPQRPAPTPLSPLDSWQPAGVPPVAPVFPEPSFEVPSVPPPPPIVLDIRPPTGPAAEPSSGMPDLFANDQLDKTVARTFAVPRIRLDNGQELDIDRVTLLGRNPGQSPGFEGARLMSVSDAERSISKTHVAVGPAQDGIWVEDLNSTNGVRVNGTRLESGIRHTVPSGATVFFGDRSFVVG